MLSRDERRFRKNLAKLTNLFIEPAKKSLELFIKNQVENMLDRIPRTFRRRNNCYWVRGFLVKEVSRCVYQLDGQEFSRYQFSPYQETLRSTIKKVNKFLIKSHWGDRTELVEGIIQETNRTVKDLSQWNLRALVEQFLDMRKIWNVEFCFMLQSRTDPEPDLAATIRVISNQIELEGIDLGKFALNLSAHRRLVIHADPIEPNYAYESDGVSHPHVEDDSICLGGARTAVEDALKGLDIYSAYKMVLILLNSYNPDGAYIRLDRWEEGSEELFSCYECGEETNEEGDFVECYGCNSGYRYCPECLTRCGGCDYSFCGICIHTCSVCDETLCENCFEADTSRYGPKICSKCIAEKETQYEQETTEPEEQETLSSPLQRYHDALHNPPGFTEACRTA